MNDRLPTASVKRLMKTGGRTRVDGLLARYSRETGPGRAKLGFGARGFSRAVDRNRMKRRLQAASAQLRLLDGSECLIVGEPSAAALTFQKLEITLAQVLEQSGITVPESAR